MIPEQEQDNELPANENNSVRYFSIILNMAQEGEDNKITSVEIREEKGKDRASRIMEYLKEMLAIKEEEVKAATSPHANCPEEATKQRAMFYYFQALVKGAENIK